MNTDRALKAVRLRQLSGRGGRSRHNDEEQDEEADGRHVLLPRSGIHGLCLLHKRSNELARVMLQALVVVGKVKDVRQYEGNGRAHCQPALQCK